MTAIITLHPFGFKHYGHGLEGVDIFDDAGTLTITLAGGRTETIRGDRWDEAEVKDDAGYPLYFFRSPRAQAALDARIAQQHLVAAGDPRRA